LTNAIGPRSHKHRLSESSWRGRECAAAGVRPGLEQAEGFERPQRLPQGRPADAAVLGQLASAWQALTSLDRPGSDYCPYLLDHFL
jgi:hypothetical protein